MESFEYFKETTRVIRESLPEIEFFTMNHDENHIHLQLSIPPKMKVSDVVRTIKSISGHQLKRKFDYMRKAYWGVDGIWSDGYFVSTIGINEKVLKGYIERQG
jgi:putative transposase